MGKLLFVSCLMFPYGSWLEDASKVMVWFAPGYPGSYVNCAVSAGRSAINFTNRSFESLIPASMYPPSPVCKTESILSHSILMSHCSIPFESVFIMGRSYKSPLIMYPSSDVCWNESSPLPSNVRSHCTFPSSSVFMSQ